MAADATQLPRRNILGPTPKHRPTPPHDPYIPIKGSFMECNGFVGSSDKFETIKAGGLDTPQKLFYDTGAIAIAWALNKSGKTSKDFWTSKTEGTGFWNAVVP